MGDRAVLICYSEYEKIQSIAPAVYIHSIGGVEGAKELLKAAAPSMRHDDPEYASARLCAAACSMMSYSGGYLGVGLQSPPDDLSMSSLQEFDLNLGAILINMKNGEVKCVCGYGDTAHWPTLEFAEKPTVR